MAANKHVIVVGGGLSGLGTAVWLGERGVDVTLIEERGRLGGRTIGIDLAKADAVVDNGQHAMLPIYTRLRQYLDTIGTLGKMKWASTWVQRQSGIGSVSMTPLALVRSGALPLRDIPRLLICGIHILWQLFRLPPRLDDLSVDQWLTSIRMPSSARRLFFDPFVIALNDTPDRYSAYAMIQTLRSILLRAITDPRKLGLGYSSVDLSSLFVTPALDLLEKRGATVLTRTGVRDVVIENGQCHGVVLADGTELHADGVVLAVPPWALARIVAGGALDRYEFFQSAQYFQWAPIVSTYIWLDKPLVMTHPFEGLLGTTAEWIFDRTNVHDQRDGLGYGYSLVSSAAYRLQELTKEEVVAEVLESLREHFPEFEDREVLFTHVVRQPQATFSPRPGSRVLRRPQATPVNRLVLAGDWTETGLGSLMESAAESAHRAVGEMSRQLGIRDTDERTALVGRFDKAARR